ncbi:MAG: hypothetical protein ABJV04_12045 [Aliiglaciecola sp.]|uniref:hypothetical protein n=1 Tax=Aliiglaciecola sp. TaxID=1872441 RepID=UPI003299ECB8
MEIKRIVISVLLLCLSACQTTDTPNTTNYEAQGNLQPSTTLGCVGMNEVSSSHSTADLFLGLTACMDQGEVDKASDLYLVAMSYGYFDTRRVADRSAHQAIMVLRMNAFGDIEKPALDSFLASVTQKTSDNAGMCETLKQLGQPRYFPTYMIQHGMGAFTEQPHSAGLIDNFDSELAWKEALSVVVNCQ